MGARNVLATNLAKKINWGPRRAVKKKKRGGGKEKEKKQQSQSSLVSSHILKRFWGKAPGMAATMHHCKLRLKVSGMGS